VDRSRPQSGSRTGGRCRSGPRHGLPIREGYLRRFPEEAGSRKPRRFGAAGGAI
jgi:hypothetical protein